MHTGPAAQARPAVHLGLCGPLAAAVLAFALTLLLLVAPAGAATFSNPAVITFPDSGPAVPYPSAITVSGLGGTIATVTATVTGLSHTFPGDVELLLVSPSGQAVLLLADTGSGTDAVNVNLTFDDAAPTMVPLPIVSGTYRPTFGTTVAALPAPAPPLPYGSQLQVFSNTDPNGTWNLFVYDDMGADTGSIAGGWSLDITTDLPTVTTFSPATAPAGAPVVISGTFFTGATAVLFGGKPATSFVVNSATLITAIVPSGAFGGPITVTTPSGSVDSTEVFQLVWPPCICELSLTSGRMGAPVIITGHGFTGATAVRFGGKPAADFTVDSETQITASLPAGARTGTVTVVGPGGSVQSTQTFVVRHSRTLSLQRMKDAQEVRGRLTANDGFTAAAAEVRVQLQKRTPTGWRTVASARTGAKGHFHFTKLSRPGAYRVLAPATTLASGDVCLKSLSSKFFPRHPTALPAT